MGGHPVCSLDSGASFVSFAFVLFEEVVLKYVVDQALVGLPGGAARLRLCPDDSPKVLHYLSKSFKALHLNKNRFHFLDLRVDGAAELETRGNAAALVRQVLDGAELRYDLRKGEACEVAKRLDDELRKALEIVSLADLVVFHLQQDMLDSRGDGFELPRVLTFRA